ncbi:Thioesterase superfamily protein [Sulfobacillus thermosulfidooxidans DSM 9293]|uniref:Thioesterase superfamily protein n=1 Tax=Sulfobacillus thermosulfidooxidans (strain DSM 9293 / VKM B-1269 / AT-1) TaxID=929705 RepID=A0A1W1WFP0_SULTA|nr:hotdog domain-containing protein [Sulfobacillus thermosulfidooxidans]SMC04523.1 Thioesterase superfamily protein [Sulfobacillus thermosulfidooxidans DSM 9293]
MTCSLDNIPDQLIYDLTARVTDDMTAQAVGNPTPVPVLATPVLLGLCEKAAAEALLPFLDDQCLIVGVNVSLTHHSPTPVGSTVTIHVTLAARDGNKFTWDITGHDDFGDIVEVRLTSAVISQKALERRLQATMHS